MNYEQRYKEALEKARQLCVYPTTKPFISDLQDLFPELKESEDERIKKAIHIYLDWLDGRKDYAPKGEYSIRDMIAWLEKQGKQKSVEWHIEDEQNLNACLGYIPDELLRRWLKDVIHAKYDKHINKLEAKFHKVDWITIK